MRDIFQMVALEPSDESFLSHNDVAGETLTLFHRDGPDVVAYDRKYEKNDERKNEVFFIQSHHFFM